MMPCIHSCSHIFRWYADNKICLAFPLSLWTPTKGCRYSSKYTGLQAKTLGFAWLVEFIGNHTARQRPMQPDALQHVPIQSQIVGGHIVNVDVRCRGAGLVGEQHSLKLLSVIYNHTSYIQLSFWNMNRRTSVTLRVEALSVCQHVAYRRMAAWSFCDCWQMLNAIFFRNLFSLICYPQQKRWKSHPAE